MKIAVLKETFPGELRVALAPESVASLTAQKLQVLVERSAGSGAGFADSQYESSGAVLVSRDEAFAADLLLQVRTYGTNPDAGRDDLVKFRPGQTVIGMCDPLGNPQASAEMADLGITVLALEMIPRIARAQAMDALSSMAMIAGYRAVLLAANHLPRLFPMVTYAAGLLRPARVFVIGAGAAGLRAIATARQLGAVVQAHDIRPGSSQEARSIGAKFIELPLNDNTEDDGGYARVLSEADHSRQRELVESIAIESDVVITAISTPGQRAPVLLTAAAIQQMHAGSVVVDLAAQCGGNCELTQPDEMISDHSVTILGPTNITTQVPDHASQMFGSNMAKLLLHVTEEGELALNLEDEIICETLIVDKGQVVHTRIRDLLGIQETGEPLIPELQPAREEILDPETAPGDDQTDGDHDDPDIDVTHEPTETGDFIPTSTETDEEAQSHHELEGVEDDSTEQPRE